MPTDRPDRPYILSLKNWTSSRLGRSLVWRILAAGTLVTSVLIFWQLWTEYQRGLGSLEQSCEEIYKSSSDSIGRALWQFDRDHMQLVLHGITHSPQIAAVDIYNLDHELYESIGRKDQGENRSFTFPIQATIKGEVKVVGSMVIYGSLQPLFQQLRVDFVRVVLSQSLKSLIMTLFIFIILYQQVVHPLHVLGRGLKESSASDEALIVSHPGRPKAQPDEIDDVALALKAYQGRIRDHLEQQTRQAKEQLRLADELIDAQTQAMGARLSQGVIHDLNNFLTVTAGNLTVALKKWTEDDTVPNPEQLATLRKLLKRAAQSAEAATRVAQAQLESGSSPASSEWISIEEVVKTVCQIHEPALNRRAVAVVVHIAKDCRACMPKALLITSLFNIVKNALEAFDQYGKSEGGGHLEFRTQQVSPDTLILEVEDNGPGIDPQNLSKIFHHGFTTKAKGHGLGLSFCKTILMARGGDLQVKSDGMGQGCCFQIHLPLYEQTDNLERIKQ